jgi:hypothetical protein
VPRQRPSRIENGAPSSDDHAGKLGSVLAEIAGAALTLLKPGQQIAVSLRLDLPGLGPYIPDTLLALANLECQQAKNPNPEQAQ